jgi:tetratricopeptide (TPR) repeat protein
MIGIVQLGSHAIADRYLYLPAIGVFIAIVWGVSGVLRESSPRLRMAAAAIFVTVLVPLALMSRAQIEVWRRSETLFRHATRSTDANYNMHFRLASTLKQRGRIEEAIAEYKKAIAIHPGMVRAHYHLANTFTDEKQIDAAIEHMRIAANSRPSPAGARDALGRLMIQTGDISRALTHFRQEMALRLNSIEVRVTLALLLQTAGQLPEAIRAYEAAIALAPEDDRWSGAAAALRQQLEARNQEP